MTPMISSLLTDPGPAARVSSAVASTGPGCSKCRWAAKGCGKCVGKEGRGSSPFRGVSRCAEDGKFEVYMRATDTTDKQLYFGRYGSEEDAARTYDRAQIAYKKRNGALQLNFDLTDYSHELDRLEDLGVTAYAEEASAEAAAGSFSYGPPVVYLRNGEQKNARTPPLGGTSRPGIVGRKKKRSPPAAPAAKDKPAAKKKKPGFLRAATLRQMAAIKELGRAVEAKDREHAKIVQGLRRELREAQQKIAALVEEGAKRERLNARAPAQNEPDFLRKVAELTDESALREKNLASQEKMIEMLERRNARLQRLVDEQGTRGG